MGARLEGGLPVRPAGFVNISEAWTLGPGNQLDTSDPHLPPGTKLPIILPPSYGRWHANIDMLDPTRADARWLEQANLDPRQRVAAAFGTLVVQKNQEDFAARAWAQYGELFKANRTRAKAQFMAELLTAAEAKHSAPLAAPALLTVTSATHTRIVDADVAPGGSQRTLRAAVSASALPQAALGPALRRLLRPGGVVAKRLGTRSGAPLTQLIGQVATRAIELAPAWNAPEQRLSLTHQPAALGADRSLRLGDDFDELAPLIGRIVELLRKLKPRHPVLGEIAGFLEALLARGTSFGLVGTGYGASQHRCGAGAIRLAAELRRPARCFPRSSRRSGAGPRATRVLVGGVELPPGRAQCHRATERRDRCRTARPALDVPKVAAQVRSALRPAATVRERISALFRVPDQLKHAAYYPLSRSWPTRATTMRAIAAQAHLAGPCGAEPGVARKQLDHAARVQLAIHRELPGRAELRDGT